MQDNNNIKRIAELCGVSVKTVSRAFKPGAVIKPETRERILKIAKENGYKPNKAAGRLASKEIKIGVCYSGVEPVKDPITGKYNERAEFNADLISGIRRAADELSDSRVSIIEKILRFSWDEDRYLALLDEFEKENVNGIITTNTFSADRINEKYGELRKKGIKIALLNDENDGRFDFSSSNDVAMTGKLTAELMSLMKKGGRCLVVTGDRTARNENICDEFTSEAKRYGFDVLPPVYCSDIPGKGTPDGTFFDGFEEKNGKLDFVYITVGDLRYVTEKIISRNDGHHFRIIATDIITVTADGLLSGKIDSIIYQNPFAQSRIAVKRMFSLLTGDDDVPKLVKVQPQIVLKNNLDKYNLL